MAVHPLLCRKNHYVWAGHLAMLLICLLAIPSAGQVPGTTISGVIGSAAGGTIANAMITLKNLATNEIKSFTANADGSFELKTFASGRYEITASAPGYAPAAITINLTADPSPPANLVLQPLPTGGAAKTSAGSSVSSVVDSNSVSNLPLNGRSASDLAALEPGVSSARTQQTGQAQRGFGNQMTISGGRPRQNDARLDGISVNDYVNGPPGSALLGAGKWSKSIPGFRKTQGVVYIPSLNRVFVASGDDGMLRVFRGDNLELLDSIKLELGPNRVTYDPHKSIVYVGYGGKDAGKDYGEVGIIDANTDKRLIGKIPTKSGAGTSFWSPELDRFYVGAPASDKEEAAILVYEPQP
jgi:Carboxypeptidase regulatory-like domain